MIPRILLMALMFGVRSAGVAAADELPKRIVSINLCTDQLLLALADPNQIAALSIYATDARMSFLADRAKGFRHDAGAAETVVGLDPDVVLAGTFTKRATRDMLTRLGYRLVLVPPARTVADSIEQIRTVAALVGHPERGDGLVAEIEAARARVASAAISASEAPTAAVYQRRGYVTGGDTLTGELLSTAGFRNVGSALAGRTGGFVPLERMIAERPDYLVVASADPRAEDQGSALLDHPALARDYPPQRRIILPERLTVCAGPSLPAAFDWIAAEARRVRTGS